MSDADPAEEASRLADDSLALIAGACTLAELDQVESEVLGRRSRLSELRAALKDAPESKRKELGKVLNSVRAGLLEQVQRRSSELAEAARAEVLEDERLDLSEAQGRVRGGHLHPVTQTWQLLEDVFIGMGFTVEDGPEVETDWFNFEALNLPRAHPARSLWDTLYVDTSDLQDVADDQVVLRTHTSPVQVRTMLKAGREGTGPPIHVVCPGRVYRRDTADATHLPVFHQIEGLVVDRDISMGDLAGTIEEFTRAYFGQAMTSRLRPSYFPFTEPSAEFDISQPDGTWLEVGGCGMVHPNVLRYCGLDPEQWSGFAFGFGIDRLAFLRHGITDLRDMITNDMRFLEQF